MERVGDLIVILRKNNEHRGWLGRHHRTARLVLPEIPLPLIEKATFDCRKKFLGLTTVVSVVGFTPAGKGYPGGVVKVIVPHAIETIPALLDWRHADHLLWLILRDQHDLTLSSRLPCALRNLG